MHEFSAALRAIRRFLNHEFRMFGVRRVNGSFVAGNHRQGSRLSGRRLRECQDLFQIVDSTEFFHALHAFAREHRFEDAPELRPMFDLRRRGPVMDFPGRSRLVDQLGVNAKWNR